MFIFLIYICNQACKLNSHGFNELRNTLQHQDGSLEIKSCKVYVKAVTFFTFIQGNFKYERTFNLLTQWFPSYFTVEIPVLATHKPLLNLANYWMNIYVKKLNLYSF